MSIALADSAAVAVTEVEGVGIEVVLSDAGMDEVEATEGGMEVEMAGRCEKSKPSVMDVLAMEGAVIDVVSDPSPEARVRSSVLEACEAAIFFACVS